MELAGRNAALGHLRGGGVALLVCRIEGNGGRIVREGDAVGQRHVKGVAREQHAREAGVCRLAGGDEVDPERERSGDLLGQGHGVE